MAPCLLLPCLGGLAAAPAVLGQTTPPVPLRCRLGSGPWQRCAMVVEQPGERWTIEVAGRRIGFQHDGTGRVRMSDPAALTPGQAKSWLPVDTTWIAGPALCWDGVCAQGEIPLD